MGHRGSKLTTKILTPKEDRKQSTIHIENVDSLSVDIVSTEESMNGFIYNIINIRVDDKHWIERAESAALLVIHTLFRPLQPSEPLELDDPLSLRNIAGEGKIAEHKTCLGWDIRTHSLRVFLPRWKQTAWATDIK